MSLLKKQVILCALGTIFEWYDFSLFACLAPILSQIFFQHANPVTAMMGTFAIFASGYVMRPIGAMVFGKLGDQFGRKYSLLLTIFIMTIATTAIGLIPTGSAWATLFLVICRLAQGFSCSGEYPGILTLLSEQNSTRRKSFIASTAVFATGFGGVVGAALYMTLLAALGHDAMLQWGWRIPFLLGAPLGFVGYLLRKYILESAKFTELKEKNLLTPSPILDIFKYHSKSFFAVLFISILTNTVIYINYVFIGSYTFNIHKITQTQVAYLALIVPLLYSFSTLFFGYLADRVNKINMLAYGCLLLILFTYPLFSLIMNGTVAEQFIGQMILECLLGIVMGPFCSILPEQFPAQVRYSSLSLTLNFAASFFGGTSPMVCNWLINISGSSSLPAFYIILLSLFALCGVLFIKTRRQMTSIPNVLLNAKLNYSD